MDISVLPIYIYISYLRIDYPYGDSLARSIREISYGHDNIQINMLPRGINMPPSGINMHPKVVNMPPRGINMPPRGINMPP